MSETKPPLRQPDIVRLSDEDAPVKLLERLVGPLREVLNELTQSHRPMLGEGNELLIAMGFTTRTA